jgi:hypothetical protein
VVDEEFREYILFGEGKRNFLAVNNATNRSEHLGKARLKRIEKAEEN